jgi:hypothetical protein
MTRTKGTRPFQLGDLDSPEIRTFEQRKNVQLLREQIAAGESIAVVVRATAEASPRAGLLALTNRRLVFVREQVIRRGPFVLTIPLADVEDVEIEAQPLTGRLRVVTERKTFVFDRVRPKMRTWNLFWRLKKDLGSRHDPRTRP